MYPTSQRYKDQIKQLTRDFTISILVTPKSGSAFTLTDADVTNGSVVFEDSVMSGDVLELGNTIAGSFEFEMILNPTNKLVDFAEASIQPTVTLILPATETYPTPSSESIPMGVFHIDSIDKGRKTTKFKALDNMSKLDVDYSKSTLVYPATLTQIYEDICSYCQVPVNPTQTLYEYTVPRKPKAGVTFRNVLGSIAEINASYAKCNRLGQIVIEWLKTNNSIATLIDPNVRSKLISDDFVQPITGVTMETMSNIYTGIGSQPGNVVSLSENLLIQNNQQAILNHFDNTGVYETFVVPHKTTWSGDPSIEAGDRVAVTTIDNESFNTNITHNKYKYRGSCEANCGAQVNGETNVIRSCSKNQSDTGAAVKALANYAGYNVEADGAGYSVIGPKTYGSPWVIPKFTDFTGDWDGGFVYVGPDSNLVLGETIRGKVVDSFKGLFLNSTTLVGVKNENKHIHSMHSMFRESGNGANSLELSDFYTKYVIDMTYMFYGSNYTDIFCRSFDTSNVNNMSRMFYMCYARNIDISSFDTPKVGSMSYMFDTARYLDSLDVSSFSTHNVEYMNNMFRLTGSSGGLAVLDLHSFNTSKVKTMAAMFNYCGAKQLNLTSFDTTTVKDMSNMFSYSDALVLDLRSFDMSGVTTKTNMLTGCSATTGIARTQNDADILNDIPGKPSGLTFYPIV